MTRNMSGAVLAIALAASPLAAQQVGEQIQGVITDVELRDSPRTVTVDRGRDVVVAHIANRTRIVFAAGDAGFFPDPGVGDLKPGMEVRFKWLGENEHLERIHVVRVPHELRPDDRRGRPGSRPNPRPEPTPVVGGHERPDDRSLRVRILDVDRRRQQVRADVAGRSQVFRADRRLIRQLDPGRLVVIRIEPRRGQQWIVAVESTTRPHEGRVTGIDRRGRWIEIDRRSYDLESPRLVRKLDEGDRVRFEYEQRGRGRALVTWIEQ